ncbi:MAG: histidine phosphatase family protein, partial [Mesorhizobium sp.]
MPIAYYITHPQVQIDADIPVPEWRLSDIGRARASAMLDQPWV